MTADRSAAALHPPPSGLSEFTPQILALRLDQIRQDVLVVVINDRDKVHAPVVDLELDQDLVLGVGIVRVEALVLGHGLDP